MDKVRRLGALAELVRLAGGRVEGRKKLHKLAFLCQRKGVNLGQTFDFHMYGVYSPSLAQDLRDAVAWQLVAEHPLGSGGYEIRTGKARLPDGTASPPAETPELDAVRALAKESPGLLEVLSTIVYLHDVGFRDGRLEAKLAEVKGHLSGWFERAFELAEQHYGVTVNAHARAPESLLARPNAPIFSW